MEVYQVCTTSFDDMDPYETDDYDEYEDPAYEHGFEDGAEEERAKWLPLWEAIKELEKVDDFWSELPNRYKTEFWGSSSGAPRFKDLNAYDQHQIMMARREIHRVLLVLRSQGER